MITAAIAAETGAATVPLWQQENFWLSIAFLIFIFLMAKMAWGKIVTALDARAELIRSELNEARTLREEAQAALSGYQRKQRDAAREAEDIIRMAEEQAQAITRDAEQALEETLRRREQLAEEKIEQAKARAIADIRAEAVDIAMAATRQLITANMDESRAEKLLNDAISDLPKHLQ